MGTHHMNPLSLEFLILTFLLLLLPCLSLPNTTSPDTIQPSKLEISIGIGIGGGGGSISPPPQTVCPLPPPPPSSPTPNPPSNPPKMRIPKPPTSPRGSPPITPSPKPPRSPRGSPPNTPSPNQPLTFVNALQRQAYFVIQQFKATITSDPNNITKTWVGSKICAYKGFRCETPPNRKNTPTVASVDFNGYHLGAPTIKGFVDRLPDLALFHANSNNFKGTVPNLTQLPYLYELDVSNNKLNGNFPYNVIPLNNLLFLDIRFNSFAGVVPGNVFTLHFLRVLFLNNNFFNQPIPAVGFGDTPVEYLTLANNGFTGPIPRTIGNLSNSLVEVLFLNNRLSGCLPYEVGLLKKATVFDVGFNGITGTIPLSFGCLGKVEQLNLAGNRLYGEVPDVVCQLAKTGHLANLTLSGNYFTSVGTSCLKLIQNKVLHLKENCIPSLPNQRSVAECAAFSKQPKVCPALTNVPCQIPLAPSQMQQDKPVANQGPVQPRSLGYAAVHNGHA